MADEANFGEDIVSSEEEEAEEESEEDENVKSNERDGENNLVYEEGMDTTERDDSVSDSKEAMMEMGNDGSRQNANDDDEDDDNSKSGDDDDKESSYRSSPPDSPMMSPNPASFSNQIMSPSRSMSPTLPLIRGDETLSVSEIPKDSMDDREGELDFEEDTQEDTESTVEQSKKEEKEKMEENELEALKPNKDEDLGENADPDDDGEVDDDDDLEEGEVKDTTNNRKIPQRPMCRFFNKGQCTWGNNCRFLHPGVNDKGNYNMFATSKPGASNGLNSVYTWHAGGSRQDSYYNKGFSDPVMPPPPLPPPPPVHDEPPRESAWERGLRHAKEIMKKSNQRKEMEPDFEEKRLNLSLSSNDVFSDYEKENDYYSRSSPYRRASDRYSYEYEDPLIDPYERQAHEYWRGGNYENFEVRYMRSDYEYRDNGRSDRMRETDRSRMERVRERDREVFHAERERDGRSRRDKFERQNTPERAWRDEHYNESQSQNRSNRGDEWRDPWRRSTSPPKRVDQRRSYSSNSSASYSSSRSSGSHSSYTSGSRSSSASSHSSYSSRSYSRTRMHMKPQLQHKAYPTEDVPIVGSRRAKMPIPAGQQLHHVKVPRHQQEKWSSSTAPPPQTKASSPIAVLMDKKKIRPNANRPMIREGSISSTGSSSRSRSGSSHTSGSSRSRGSSASSLESVSSKSSISSKSSFGSQHKAQVMPGLKRDERQVKSKRKMYDNPGGVKVVEKVRENKVNVQLQAINKSAPGMAKALSKDLLKQSGQKTQIKLTLLNKEKAAANAPSIPVVHRKENLEAKRVKVAEREPLKAAKPVPINPQSRKRAASPLHPGADIVINIPKTSKALQASTGPAAPKALAAISAISKKSTSSRREELLKQLKAVEDAIARKRAKLS